MATAPDFSELETRIRQQAERQIAALKTIEATHAAIVDRRTKVLAEDAEDLKKLNAALAESAGVFTDKDLAAWKLPPLVEGKGGARRPSATRKKSGGDRRPTPVSAVAAGADAGEPASKAG